MPQAVLLRVENGKEIWGNPSSKTTTPITTTKVSAPQGITITPSNVFGTASNVLQPGEVEITRDTVSSPQETKIVPYQRQDVFGQPPVQYYGTSSMKYGEVSPTGERGKTADVFFSEQYTSPDVAASNIQFVKELNPKIEQYKTDIQPYETERLDYERDVKAFNELAGQYQSRPYYYEGLYPGYGTALAIRAGELNVRQGELSKTYKELESKKGYTDAEVARAKNISLAFDIQMETLAPEIQAAEKLKAMETSLSTKYFGGKEVSEKNLAWSEKAKLWIPFYDTKFEKDLETYNVAAAEFNKKYPIAPTIDLSKPIPLESVPSIVSRETQFAKESAKTKINKENWSDFYMARNILQSEQLKLQGMQTAITQPEIKAIQALIGKERAYDVGTRYVEAMKYPTLVALSFTPLSAYTSIPVVGSVVSSVAATRIGGLAIGAARGYGQFRTIIDPASQKVIVPTLSYLGTGIETGDWSLKNQAKLIPVFQSAYKTEQSQLKPIGGIKSLWLKDMQRDIAQQAPFLTTRSGRFLLGGTIFVLSKGKIGKGIGLGIGLGGSLISTEGYLSNVEAYKSALAAQNLSPGEIAYLTKLRSGQRIASGIEMAYISTSSELLGEAGFARQIKAKPIVDASTTKMTTLWGIPVKESFKAGYVASRNPLLVAGLYEGIVTAEIAKGVTYERPTLKEYAYYGGLGAVSARVIGGTVIGLSTTRRALPKPGVRESGVMSGVYITDLNEYIGDRLAGEVQNVMGKRFGVDITQAYIKPGTTPDTISMYASTTKGRRVPIRINTDINILQEQFDNIYTNTGYDASSFRGSTINVPGETSVSQPTRTQAPMTVPISVEMPMSVRSSMPVNLRSNVPVQTSMPISVRSTLPINVNVGLPVNVPINAPVNVPVNMPVFNPISIKSPANIFVPMPINVPAPINVNLPMNIDVPQPINVPEPINVNMPINVPIVVPSKGLILPFTFRDTSEKGYGKKTKKKTAYTPDFIGLVSGLTTRKRPGTLFTGQEIRPIFVGR